MEDDDIATQHGGLIWQALQAFAIDPGYFELICTDAYAIDARTCPTCRRVFGNLSAASRHDRAGKCPGRVRDAEVAIPYGESSKKRLVE